MKNTSQQRALFQIIIDIGKTLNYLIDNNKIGTVYCRFVLDVIEENVTIYKEHIEFVTDYNQYNRIVTEKIVYLNELHTNMLRMVHNIPS